MPTWLIGLLQAILPLLLQLLSGLIPVADNNTSAVPLVGDQQSLLVSLKDVCDRISAMCGTILGIPPVKK